MTKNVHSDDLAEHFFRNEYGKMVSVITRYLGTDNIESAEDIVQDTMLKASESWKHSGIPPNPQAWLYITAKNLTFNLLKRKKVKSKYKGQLIRDDTQFEQIDVNAFSTEKISDEQLKMMFVCCHPAIPENGQIALILKILCGFSITEIAQAFYTNNETISKRLVRGRKQLKELKINIDLADIDNSSFDIVLKTIFLLFNEGYCPNQQNQQIRYDLCLEAIRLAEILNKHHSIKFQSQSSSLLALMYLNASRFAARTNNDFSNSTLDKQDRSLWDQDLINTGIHYLNSASKETQISKYLILAAISANHCIAKNFDETNWVEINSLYNDLIQIENSPITRINRSVAISKTKGYQVAISELLLLSEEINVNDLEVFHATIGEFYRLSQNTPKAIEHLQRALVLCANPRNSKLLENKLKGLS